jgi:methylmalonyl-CoA mutase N-terminal domain/subunit
VLGGTQSLHTNSYDETYALPTEDAVTLALRTQQIIAEESGVPAVADPLGGSYFVERLTSQVEEAAMAYIEKIDEMGGIVRAIEEGYPQREIANSAYQFQKQVDAKERIIVGVNKYRDPSEEEKDQIPILKIDPEVEKRQIAEVKRFRAARDQGAAARALEGVAQACASDGNIMVAVLEAVRKHVTLGEVCDVFRKSFGEHHDPAYL